MPDNYEYKVQYSSTDFRRSIWYDTSSGWTDANTAAERFNGYVKTEDDVEEKLGVRISRYRIIRRPKGSEEVWITERTKL